MDQNQPEKEEQKQNQQEEKEIEIDYIQHFGQLAVCKQEIDQQQEEKDKQQKQNSQNNIEQEEEEYENEENDEDEDEEGDWEDEEFSDDDSESENIKRRICKLCNILLEYEYIEQIEGHLQYVHKLKPSQYKHNISQYMGEVFTEEQMEQMHFDQDWQQITDQRKLDQETINKIQHYTFQEIKQQHPTLIQDKKDSTCCICITEYENEDIISYLQCKHIFHKDCLQNWLQNIGECPKCRSQIKNQIENNEI